MKKHVILAALILVLLAVSVCFADDWPQFGGLNRDGRSAETGLLKKWPEGGPRLLWVVDGLGIGFSSVAVADGYVYTTGIAGEDKEVVLFAYDVKGVFKWKASCGRGWSGPHPGSRTTPTVDGDRVYVLSGYGNLTCFDAQTGQKKWQVDTLKRFNGQNIKWGISESVLVVDDKVICTPGGTDACVAALDKISGETKWASKGLSDRSAYCAPVLVERGGRKLVVTITAAHVVGIDAETGKVLWQYQNKLHKGEPREVNPNSPVHHNGGIYITSRFVGGMKLRISPDGRNVSHVWTNESLDPHHGGVVLVNGYIYGANTKKGNWMCLDWDNGKTMYQKKWIGKGAIIYADGMLYCYEEKEGTVGLVSASPEGFDIVSSFKVPYGTAEHWAHPAISDGRLYVRHGDALMAYDIKQK
ncbi:MAG TPA: PQQ-binding-like beta-propeller repeat protein [Sedimentisphaerales bacterium]|nr:PQQ-binding-like beta-propeller repeat protein [Sedimentisphaerales bacterium]